MRIRPKQRLRLYSYCVNLYTNTWRVEDKNKNIWFKSDDMWAMWIHLNEERAREYEKQYVGVVVKEIRVNQWSVQVHETHVCVEEGALYA